MSATGPVAAVDIGSTSVRLLVTDGLSELARETVICRLGDGVDASGSLDSGRRSHALDVLRSYAQRIVELDVVRTRAVTTSVIRRARDGESFLDDAEAALGIRPELLSGEEEGSLSFAGAVSALGIDRVGSVVVVDLGGGSCEFAVGTDRCDGVFSAEFGAARLFERYLEHDPPLPEELLDALSIVEAHLDDVRRELPAVTEARTWVGIGGSFTTFADVDVGRSSGSAPITQVLTRASAEDVFRTLVTEPTEDRIHNPGLPLERAELILGGACAIVRIMRDFSLDEMIVVRRGILHGITAQLLQP